MQSRYRGGIPSQRGNGHTPILQYLMNQNQLSTDSNDSQDSMLTQVPMPYHMSPDAFAGQQGAAGQVMYNAQFRAPNFQHTAQYGGMPGASSKPLNPTSSVYVPGGSQQMGFHSQTPPMPQPGYSQWQGGPYGYSQTAPVNQYTPTSQNYGQNPQQMAPCQWSSGTQYNQGGPPHGGSMNNATTKFSPTFGAPEGSYQHSGTSASAMKAYSDQTGRSGSPVLGASAFSPGASFSYPPGSGSNVQTQSAQGNSHGQAGHFQNDRNPQDMSAGGQVGISSHGGQDFTYGARSGAEVGVNGEEHKYNLATTAVVAYNEKSHNSYSSDTGGSVQSPEFQESSPTKSRASSRLSQHSRSTADPASAHPSSHSGQGEAIKRGSTPSDQARPLNLEFSSEPRGFRSESRDSNDSCTAHQLRSRRKQSTASLSSETPRRYTDSGELEKTIKSLALSEKSDDMKRVSNPPKMLNLLGAGGISSNALSPITEGQSAYTSAPPVRSLIDPFGPTPSMNVPYNGSALLAPGNNMSNALRTLTANGTRRPSVQEALATNNLPFVEICRAAKEDTWGVVKIKNIPYSVNRAEVMAFLGRNARLINETDYEPIHIVMERVTSKTLDCYVEFVNFNEALAAVNRFEGNRNGGRSGRLGQRHVEVELSSQAALMKELFPKAKNVSWNGAKPVIAEVDPNDKYNSGFQGFVSKEELVMLVKHVEAPQRSPFSKECPQRPFECLISTLLKYPWYMVDHITIEDRNQLHLATKDLLSMLVERVQNERDPVNLTHMLLRRVCRAALKCPGFTTVMKDDIVFIGGVDDRVAMDAGVPPFAPQWGDLWTIGPKPNVPSDLLLYYIAIIREATEDTQPVLTLAQRAALSQEPEPPKLFGNLAKHIQTRPGLAHQTLGEVAQAEWAAIERVLVHALTPRIQP